jgi:hypothetical protein
MFSQTSSPSSSPVGNFFEQGFEKLGISFARVVLGLVAIAATASSAMATFIGSEALGVISNITGSLSGLTDSVTGFFERVTGGLSADFSNGVSLLLKDANLSDLQLDTNIVRIPIDTLQEISVMLTNLGEAAGGLTHNKFDQLLGFINNTAGNFAPK